MRGCALGRRWLCHPHGRSASQRWTGRPLALLQDPRDLAGSLLQAQVLAAARWRRVMRRRALSPR